MNKYYTLLIFLFLPGTFLFGQLNFVENLNADNSLCYNTSTTLKAKVEGAGTYKFLKYNEETDSWETLKEDNNISPDPTDLTHTIHNATKDFKVKLLISDENDELESDILEIIVHPELNFEFEPANISICQTQVADFWASSAQDITYQWQESTNGGSSFTNLSDGGRYGGTTTKNLKIDNITKSFNGRLYKVIITNVAGCQKESLPGLLTTNQVTGSVNPTTTSVQYCEGDIADFNISGTIGETVSYQWYARPGAGGEYSLLNEGGRFTGTTSTNLNINGITQNERDFRINVIFKNLKQLSDGTIEEGTCSVNEYRNGYKVNSYASKPEPIDEPTICFGTSTTLIAPTSTGTYKWYDDESSNSPIHEGYSYITSDLNESTTYYYTYEDDDNCQSEKQEVTVTVDEELKQSIANLPEICKAETSLTIESSNVTGNPDKLIINIPGLGLTYEEDFDENLTISLPTEKQAGTYEVLIYSEKDNCKSETTTFELLIKDTPSITSTFTNQEICEGSNYSLSGTYDYNGSEPLTFKWYKDDVELSGQSSETLNLNNLTDTDSGTYKWEITSECAIVTSHEFTIDVIPLPSIDLQPINLAVCRGRVANFDAGGNYTTIQWQRKRPEDADFSDLTGQTSDNLNIQNSGNADNPHLTHYKAIVSNDICSLESEIVTLYVNSVSVSNPSITACEGETVTIDYSNYTIIGNISSIEWQYRAETGGGWGDISGETDEILTLNNISESDNGYYRPRITFEENCIIAAGNGRKLTVNPLPVPTITPDHEICKYEETTLLVENCTGTISWNTGTTDASITVSPDQTTIYRATCTENNCSTEISVTVTVKEVESPVISSMNTSYCEGDDVVLTASGCDGTIHWYWADQTVSGNTLNIDNAQAGTITYTAKCEFEGCFSDAESINIMVHPISAKPTLSSDQIDYCEGETVELSASGCNGTITWFDGSTESTLRFTANTNNTFYTATCTENGCESEAGTIEITVKPIPAKPVLASDKQEYCEGDTGVLTSSNCAGTIVWPDNTNGESYSFTAAVGASYTVQCMVDACISEETISVTVHPIPEKPIITANKSSYCEGEIGTLSVTNCAGEVTWSTGNTGADLSFIAVTGDTYTATCEENGCESEVSEVMTIEINTPLMAGIIEEKSGEFCAGYNPTAIKSLENPTNYSSIQWQQSEDGINWADISGATSQTYDPPGLQQSTYYRRMVWNDCETLYSNEIFILVNPDPEITIITDQPEVCYGQDLNLSYTLIGGAGNCNITWQVNTVSGAASNPNWTDLGQGEQFTYSFTNEGADVSHYFRAVITCDVSSCNLYRSASVAVVFKGKPSLTTDLADSTVCEGDVLTFNTTCTNGEVLWSTGETTASISISPSSDTTVTVTCENDCETYTQSANITVKPGIPAPVLTADKAVYCFGEIITITSTGCETGTLTWSDGSTGQTLILTAENDLSISATCAADDCTSPESNVVSITVIPELSAGKVEENTGIYCAGYNPPNINNIEAPKNHEGIQWQESEDGTNWTDIAGADKTTFNPEVLQHTMHYRRMVWNNCDTLYSNTVTIRVNPDPVITVSANKTSVCDGESVELNSTVTGGAGNCTITWQINKRSSAPGSNFWETIDTGDSFTYNISGAESDSTFYFRARIDCEIASCNLNVSDAIAITFMANPIFNTDLADATICEGEVLTFNTTCPNGVISWSTGETTESITISPSSDTTITVTCKNNCETFTQSANITVKPGIPAPVLKTDKTAYCFREIITITSTGCETGTLTWSDGSVGQTLTLTAENNLSISATCAVDDCTSPESNVVSITVIPELSAGKVEENTGIYCAGYNPPNINNIEAPKNHEGIQWQESEDGTNWTDIAGADKTTFNPEVLQHTMHYRRMVWNTCDTLYSNTVSIQVEPDPVITVTSDKASVCDGESVELSSSITGGAGNCTISWQINKRSSAPGSSFWEAIEIGDSFSYSISGAESDSTFYFRARIDCDVASCNLNISDAVEVTFKALPVLSTDLADATICEGEILTFTTTCTNGEVLWSTGETSESISVSPSNDTVITVTCENNCETFTQSANITVKPGIPAPVLTADKTQYCFGETTTITSTGCETGTLTWSDGSVGQTLTLTAENDLIISATCAEDDCTSPVSNMIEVTVTPELLAGEIEENTGTYCAGYNPPNIKNIEAPKNYEGIQWQESADGTNWTDIAGANKTTFNPDVLQHTMHYRRMVWNTCDTLYSNTVTIQVEPDPAINIAVDQTEVEDGDQAHFTPEITGGAGNCSITWQMNKRSAAQGSPYWETMDTTNLFSFGLTGAYSDSTYYFRARIDCDVSSCNLNRSNVLEVTFKAEPKPLQIINQTETMVSCYNTVSNLEVQAVGTGTITYKWQRKRPGEADFTDVVANQYLSKEDEAIMRVANTGNDESPTGTLFRCVLKDDVEEIISAPIEITANRVQGTLGTQNLCIGETLSYDLNKTHTITGTPHSIQWQYRSGTGDIWKDLSDGGNIFGSQTKKLSITDMEVTDGIQFRSSITFESSKGTCVQNTGLSTAKVGTFPEAPADISKEICEGEKLNKFKITPPADMKVLWYDYYTGENLRLQPAINNKVPGEHYIAYTFANKQGCESPKAKIHVTVNASPQPPLNTTPAVYNDSNELTFSAEGENLKWYRTKTLKPFEYHPPTFSNTTGKKTYYVTQTDKNGCESERLQIVAQMQAPFNISKQPENIANCEGNTVTFRVTVKGSTNPAYQWQMYQNDKFVDLKGENDKDLKLSKVGNAPYIHGSKYRVIVYSENGKKLVSETAELRVNYLKTTLPPIEVCEGEAFNFEQYADSLSGQISKIEWQQRIGTSYNTVFESGNLSDYYSPEPNSAGNYRFRVTFHNQGSSTCVRNSNMVKFTQHKLPDMAYLDSLFACNGETIENFKAQLPETVSLLNSDSTEVDPKAVFTADQPRTFIVSDSVASGCHTPFYTITPEIRRGEAITSFDSLYTFCQFGELPKTIRINEKDTRWYYNATGNLYTLNSIDLDPSEHYSRDLYFTIISENSCGSPRQKVTVEFVPCYFEGETDTCIVSSQNNLITNEWNYFYGNEGKIYGAINPEKNNHGSVGFHIVSTQEKDLKNAYGTGFYPRTWHISADNQYKARLYLTAEEINLYATESVSILYRSAPADCEWIPDSTDFVMIAHDYWKETEYPGVYYVEFEHDQAGQYVLWKNERPRGKLSAELGENNLPNISISDYHKLTIGEYQINRGSDNTDWYHWRENIMENEIFTDALPYPNSNHYQLIYNFNNGVIAYLDEKQLVLHEKPNICTVFENPSLQQDKIKAYFTDMDINKTGLYTILGHEIPLKEVNSVESIYEFIPKQKLSRGTYFLRMVNTEDEVCLRRIVIH